MPVARTVTRAASRQLSPRLHHPGHVQVAQAGPSNPAAHPIMVADDDGPARKKQAIGRKASKQRSQQNARAPSPSEVIEISSDEDDAPVVKKRDTKVYKQLKALEEVRIWHVTS